jgi:hypothetical protein
MVAPARRPLMMRRLSGDRAMRFPLPACAVTAAITRSIAPARGTPSSQIERLQSGVDALIAADDPSPADARLDRHSRSKN